MFLADLVVIGVGLSVVALKGAYAWTALHAGWRLPWALPNELIALIATVALLSELPPGRPRRLADVLLVGSWCAPLVVYAATAAAHATLGMPPRLEFLRGLTWAMIGPSVKPMLAHYRFAMTLSGAGLLLLVAALVALRRRLVVSAPSRRSVWLFALLSLALAADAHGRGREHRHRLSIIDAVLRSEASDTTVTAAEAQREQAFFRWHDARLRAGAASDARFSPLLAASRGKNIVFVTMESVRAKDLAIYGGPVQMPFLQSLGAKLLRLDGLYSQDIRSTKAFAAFELGRYELLDWESYSHGFPTRYGRECIARRMSRLGYRTLVAVNGDPAYDNNGPFHADCGYETVLYQPQIVTDGSGNSNDDAMLARVDEALGRQDGRPVYMHLWPLLTHHPYGREYWSDIDGWLRAHPEGIRHGGADDLARYGKSLVELDDFIRQLVDIFRKHGAYESTTFVFAGDHGEAFGEHSPSNVFHGNDVFEESVHVAGFVHNPAIEGPLADDRLFMLKDIPASLLDLAGADSPFFGSGRSIFHQYSESMPVYLYNSWSRIFGIIHDGWKMRMKDGTPLGGALERIRSDPGAEELPIPVGEMREGLEMELRRWKDAMGVTTRRMMSSTKE